LFQGRWREDAPGRYTLGATGGARTMRLAFGLPEFPN
jgi:hypothetical protein